MLLQLTASAAVWPGRTDGHTTMLRHLADRIQEHHARQHDHQHLQLAVEGTYGPEPTVAGGCDAADCCQRSHDREGVDDCAGHGMSSCGCSHAPASAQQAAHVCHHGSKKVDGGGSWSSGEGGDVEKDDGGTGNDAEWTSLRNEWLQLREQFIIQGDRASDSCA